MYGRAVALGAGTVLNALSTGVGSAFAIDAETTATVELDDSATVTGTIAEDADAGLVVFDKATLLPHTEHPEQFVDLITDGVPVEQ